jgi:tagatose 1,6-diphosphate aldolase
LLCALEEQGYLGDAFSRRTPMLEGWSVEKSKELGANGVKILLFYHPDSGQAAEAQEVLVRSIVEDCRRHEIPFFLEPISYPLDPKIKKNSPEFARARRRVVIESARRLSALGADVMKVEFPLDAGHDSDPGLWAEACAELNEACAAPWALLSAGEPFETFKDQLPVACRAGGSGFVAGRALWQEAAKLSGAERGKFLSETAYRRLRELSDITEEYGAAWHDTSRLRLGFP